VNRKMSLILIILDGWGYLREERGNAIVQAPHPNFNRMAAEYPFTPLRASGEAVGLPEGQIGNSEVGHLNIGAGRVVYQELPRISLAIKNGNFFDNESLVTAIDSARDRGKALHLMGLLSDGGVHSHITHLYALLEMAKERGLTRVFVHAFLDGRDVPPMSALGFIKALEDKMSAAGVGKIATVMGRFYAMDRDKRWDRVEKAYRAMVLGQGIKAETAYQSVKNSYEDKATDEFVVPRVIVDQQGNPVGRVGDHDSIIFFNFRADRAREITRAFVDEDFQGFERPADRPHVHYVCLTQYDATINAPAAFPPQSLSMTLGEVLSRNGLRQLRIAETEKYAHVTFFFNGGMEEPFPGEDRVLIPSPKVATYDKKPEMSAYEVTDRVVELIKTGSYDVIVLNFANPDMIGHTGIMDAACDAICVVDNCLGRVVNAIREQGGVAIVTSDHGNAEQMVEYQTGEPYTAHTTNQVPFVLVDDDLKSAGLRHGSLEDIAPTIMQLLGLPKPKEMTGNSLLLDRPT